MSTTAKAPKLAAERPLLTNRAGFVSAAICWIGAGSALSWTGADRPPVELPPLVAAQVCHPLSLGFGLLGAGVFFLALARIHPGGRLGRNLRRFAVALSFGLPAVASSSSRLRSSSRRSTRPRDRSPRRRSRRRRFRRRRRRPCSSRREGAAFKAFVAAFEKGDMLTADVCLREVLDRKLKLAPNVLRELRDGVAASFWTRVLAAGGTLAANARAFLTLAAGDDVKVATKLASPGKSVVYVLDLSESMAGDPAPYVAPDGSVLVGTRLDRAKATLIRSLMSLPRDWTFNLETLDGKEWWQKDPGRGRRGPERRDRVDHGLRDAARSAARRSAMALLAAGRENQLLVLLTDGASAGDKQPDRAEIARANVRGGVVNVIGVGTTSAGAALCRAIAKENQGGYALIR